MVLEGTKVKKKQFIPGPGDSHYQFFQRLARLCPPPMSQVLVVAAPTSWYIC